MRLILLLSIILPVFSCCQSPVVHKTANDSAPVLPEQIPGTNQSVYHVVADIPLPEGYQRVGGRDSAFAAWLRQVKIRKDNRVFLYNGQLKRNQSAQFAVLDLPVGKKDLQQCADAVMRLRAEYLYHHQQFDAIVFADNNGKQYRCPRNSSYPAFEQYLEKVFAFCGTLSLEKQLHRVTDFQRIQPGDVLIKGGSPGHAVIVMDMAVNKQGKKIYLLAQSYMPAQDIHILKNSLDEAGGPWYEASNDNSLIYTPEWTFATNELRRW